MKWLKNWLWNWLMSDKVGQANPVNKQRMNGELVIRLAENGFVLTYYEDYERMARVFVCENVENLGTQVVAVLAAVKLTR